MKQGKIYSDPLSAVSGIADGAVVMIGGFGVPGRAQNLIRALLEKGARDLTCICNVCSYPMPGQYDVADLVAAGQVKKIITTFLGNPTQQVPAVDMWRRGELEIEVVPQGILTERIRAAGAGIGGLFIPNGVGNVFEGNRDKTVLDGKEYMLEMPLKADFALINAQKADSLGNLVYSLAQRNYNPTMAAAATVTIVEVAELVEVGLIDPELVVTPGIYVDRLVVTGEEI